MTAPTLVWVVVVVVIIVEDEVVVVVVVGIDLVISLPPGTTVKPRGIW